MIFAVFPDWSAGFPGGARGTELECQSRRLRCRFNPWVGKIPWRRAWQRTLVFLPGESQGQKRFGATVHKVEKSPTGLKRLSMQAQTDQLPLLVLQHFTLWSVGGAPAATGPLSVPRQPNEFQTLEVLVYKLSNFSSDTF